MWLGSNTHEIFSHDLGAAGVAWWASTEIKKMLLFFLA